MGSAVAIGVGSKVLEIMGQNRGLEKQAQANNKTIQGMIKSMNYSFQNFEQNRRDAFEATIAQLEKAKIQGSRQVTSVEASINEGIMGGGRTANLLKRSVQADLNRTVSSIKENNTKRMNEIDLNKETTLLNTKNQINAIPKVEAPSLLDTALQIGTAYLMGKQADEAIDLMQTKAGVNGGGILGNNNNYTFSTQLTPINPYSNLYYKDNLPSLWTLNNT